MQLGIAETKENQVGVENEKFSAKTLYIFKVFIINSIICFGFKRYWYFQTTGRSGLARWHCHSGFLGGNVTQALATYCIHSDLAVFQHFCTKDGKDNTKQ